MVLYPLYDEKGNLLTTGSFLGDMEILAMRKQRRGIVKNG